MKPLVNNLADAWNRFWFTPTDPTTLAVVRIATGLVLLFVYGFGTPGLMEFVGPRAWVDGRALAELRQGGAGAMTWGQSVWFFVQHPTAIVCLHAIFLAAIAAFTLGWWTRTMNVLVWVGHLSFVHRAYLGWSGMDTVLAMLTFYLMLGPSGAALSLDRRRRQEPGEPRPSWSATVALRLIQVHMCVIYLCAGLSKLQGARWWDGTAVWHVLMLSEFAPFDLTWLAFLGDGPCHFLSNVGVILTLGMEISFAFLVWNPRIRPALLVLAVLLHAGIGLCMGLGAFGAAMLAGCLAFVPAETVRGALQKIRPRLAPGDDASAAVVPFAAPSALRRAA